jgi:hypothetical protein
MPDLLLGIGTIKNLQQAKNISLLELIFISPDLYLKLVGFKSKEFYIAQAV